jgi:hypothetical protein
MRGMPYFRIECQLAKVMGPSLIAHELLELDWFARAIDGLRPLVSFSGGFQKTCNDYNLRRSRRQEVPIRMCAVG